MPREPHPDRAQLNIRIPESHCLAAKIRARSEGLTLGGYIDSLIVRAVDNMPVAETTEIIADLDQQIIDLQAARARWASHLADLAMQPESNNQ